MMEAAGSGRRRAAFLDRDGVINVDHGYVVRREDFSFVPGVLAGARSLRELGFALVVITNQSGIGRGLYSFEAFRHLIDWMKAQFEAAGAPIAGVYFCPHHPTEAVGDFRRPCDCRKPAPGMLLTAARDLGLDLGTSVLFGDKESDLLAARAAGVPERVLLGTDGAALPAAPAPDGLATARFRRLDEALSDASLLAALRVSGTVPE
jgi:D-glycero-D-manno-heptose 1,7-bisphosphate phosphatase